ncbi:polymer-forming cytoskeletal protein [bacterium]|nr:MAG: polymer-forming cytoskeletal protein [bacterium]
MEENDMNGKKDKQSATGRGEIKAFLGEGTDFKGILTFEGTVRIDGKLEGEIITKDTLIVGESAMVNAEINVHTIVISGVVRGNINSTGRVEVHRPGKLFGNIKTPSLLIEEGVIFEGSCSMTQEESKVSPLSAKKESGADKEIVPAVKND